LGHRRQGVIAGEIRPGEAQSQKLRHKDRTRGHAREVETALADPLDRESPGGQALFERLGQHLKIEAHPQHEDLGKDPVSTGMGAATGPERA